jgi:hypothetical protein
VAGIGYEAGTGRLNKATHGPIDTSADVFTYAYVDASNLVSTVTGPQHTVTSTYET